MIVESLCWKSYHVGNDPSWPWQSWCGSWTLW